MKGEVGLTKKYRKEFLNIALSGLRPSPVAPGTYASASLRQHNGRGESVVLREQNVCGPKGL